MSIISGLTLAVFAALSGSLTKEETMRQYRLNIVEWKDFSKKNKKKSPEGFLNEQWLLSGFLYGTASKLQEKLFFKGRPITAKENSCEVIASYNALLSLGSPEPFPEVLKEYSQGGICFHGIFGTDPKAIKRFFEKRGFAVKAFEGEEIERLKSEGDPAVDRECAYIFTTYNRKNNPFSMIHTMCITVEDTGYQTHNDAEGNKIYPTVYDAVVGYEKGRSGPFYVLRICPLD